MKVDDLDKTLAFFYNNRKFRITDIEVANALFGDMRRTDTALALIKHLEEKGHVIRHENKQFGDSYSISFNGAGFFEKPPRPLKNRPYKYMATIDNIKIAYTIAKIIMTVISTCAIILISYLAYRAQEKAADVKPPTIIIKPTIIGDSLKIDTPVINP